jgi:flagellar hook-length control protein FliK
VSQLRQSLIDSGVQLSGLNISQHGPSGQKGETSNQNTNSNQYSQRSVPQNETTIKETLRTERRTGQSSEVDYLI